MQSDNASYDTLIIGTSPLAITEAVYQKSLKRAVLNIDNRGIIGGAWTTIKHQGIPEVEIGCHIWEVQKWATDFLTAFYNLQLAPLDPPPRLFKKGVSIPYDWKMNLSTSKYIASKCSRLKFKELKAGMKSPARRLTLLPSKYLYPRGGAKELYLRVLDKVKENDLNIRLNTSLETIDLTGSDCKVELSNEPNVLNSDRLILTSLSDIKKIMFEDGTEMSPDTKQVDYIHLHLLVTGSIPRKFSYHRLMDDDTIHRVSDMTFQVREELNDGQVLISVGIHAKTYHAKSQEDLLDSIFDKLKKRKLINKDAKLDAHGFNVFPSYYTRPDLLSKIEELSKGKITILRSTSFTFSFHNRKKQYQTLV